MSTSELSSRISARLAQDIAVGEIACGAHLRAQEVADRYKVSRTPIREAFAALEEQGILRRFPNRGYFVADSIPQNIISEIKEAVDVARDEYQIFAEDWLTDQLPEIVTEQALRQRYNMTKARLSDLLARAAREGWAERKEGYGWRLLPVAKTAEAFDEIYRFRMAIEPAAMLEPSFKLNKEALASLRRTQERMLEGGVNSLPAEKLLDNGATFHEELARMSNNPFFLSALERVNRMRRLMEYRTKIDRQRLTEQCTDHLEIVSLLEQGEVLEASFFMRRHLSSALRRKARTAKFWSMTHQKD
ncbi:GntR family transcriptional regulator [Paracoccus rhizosphaerae]|uniref:GntR family transcriptional regulator n=1 Tax=Paracoccus rhizosphaerae TaxID=1133347 RepID=A0ABV6CGA1_9RHOB|nr:GntR family transcriptional regulator [Paracoccus rhizosphaerae]